MTAARHARDYASTFVIYGLVALAATWPLARDFSTWLLGDVPYDQRHTIWILWHTKEALLGRQPWFTANLLYHPHGISTLVDGVGPVSGLLALPFWYLPSSISSNSAVAAYNGATWLGFALSGVCMYALARVGIKMDRIAAFFAGLLFMMWPSHVVSLYGHLEKAFVGLLPLTVLAAILAYDPWRRPAWLFAPGLMLVATLLHNANQFTFALLAIVLIGVAGSVPRPNRIWILYAMRVVIAGILAIVISGPLVFAIARVASDPNMQVKLGEQTKFYSPDLLHLIVPSIHQAIGGRAIYPEYDVAISDLTRRSTIASLTARTGWYGSGIETAVTIPIAAIVLMFFAFVARRRQAQGRQAQGGDAQSGHAQSGRAQGDEGLVTRAGVWLLMGAVFATLALGPVLLLAGTEVMPMPYSLLAKLPGFDVMRTPGRFMMIASVGFSLAAALGLASLMARAPNRRRATLIAGAATIVILAECWPRVWMQHVPPPVPAFYSQLATSAAAADAAADDRFAVLDLPAGRWSADNGSAYMYYQLTHRRPIAWGYLSRQFVKYPIEGMMGILDQVNAPDALGTRQRLAQLGYRYVVWHKRAKELFGTRRPHTSDLFELPAVEAQSYPFLRKAFADDRPLIDDDLVTVYRIDR
jgi:hypothetical protein